MSVQYKQNGNFVKSPPNGIGLIINTLSSVNTVKYFESNISKKIFVKKKFLKIVLTLM